MDVRWLPPEGGVPPGSPPSGGSGGRWSFHQFRFWPLRDALEERAEIFVGAARRGVDHLLVARQEGRIGLLRHRFDEPEKYLAADAVGLDSARAVLADLAARELRGFGFDERDRPRLAGDAAPHDCQVGKFARPLAVSLGDGRNGEVLHVARDNFAAFEPLPDSDLADADNDAIGQDI